MITKKTGLKQPNFNFKSIFLMLIVRARGHVVLHHGLCPKSLLSLEQVRRIEDNGIDERLDVVENWTAPPQGLVLKVQPDARELADFRQRTPTL